MKHIKKLSALLMCALIALSACLTASAATNDPIKPTTGPYTLKINLYEAAKQAIIEDLDSLATNRGDGAETTPDTTKFKAYALAGVTFDIYEANSTKTGKKDGSTAQHATTDANGVATFKTNIAGTYWVKVNSLPKEVAACLDIKDGFAVDLPMTNPNGNGWLSTVNVYPKVDTVWGIANFKKVDAENKDGLEGAKFTLYRTDITAAIAAASTNEQLKTALSASGITWAEYGSTLTSVADGTFKTGRIPYGAYKLVETTPPKGHALNKTPLYFIINGLNTKVNIGSVTTDNDTYTIGEVKIINKELEGITKTLTSDSTASIGDEVTWEIRGKVPSDAGVAKYTKFEFKDTLDAAFTYKSASVKIDNVDVPSAITNNGNAVTVNLLSQITLPNANKDIVITISATLNAKASLLTGVKNKATLTYNNNGGEDVVKEATSEPVKTGGYTFKKVGSDNTDKGLAGAKFKVYKSSNNKQVTYFCTDAGLKNLAVDGIVESDANGFVHIYGLAYGDYYLVEVFAPTGYELNGGHINFKIDSNSSDTAGAADGNPIVNQKKVELPFTGGVGAEVVVASGVLMMVAAGFVLKKRVK